MAAEIPEMGKFRAAVERIGDRRDRVFIKLIYLTAARVSEVITRVDPYELKHGCTKPYGKHLRWQFDSYNSQKVLVLKLAVAKRKKKTKKKNLPEVERLVFKTIALPCDLKFEPWIKDLVLWIKDHKAAEDVFQWQFTRQRARQIVKEHLSGLDSKMFPHRLRHYRITHLVQHYNFDAYDISAYAG